MKRLAFLGPTVAAALVVSTVVALLDLRSTWSYALIAAVGFLVLTLGIAFDLFKGPHQHANVVKVQQSAILADQRYGPESGILLESLAELGWDTHKLLRDAPFRRPARRAGVHAFFVKQRKKRVEVRVSHRIDPMHTRA
jgi:hypothetical protein